MLQTKEQSNRLRLCDDIKSMYMIIVTCIAMIAVYFAIKNGYHGINYDIIVDNNNNNHISNMTTTTNTIITPSTTSSSYNESYIESDNESSSWYYDELSSVLFPKSKRTISLIINSCGRLDLLNRTISSFMKYYPHSKYPLYEKILIDDCRKKQDAINIINEYLPDFEIMFTEDSLIDLRPENHKRKEYRISTAMDKMSKQIITNWIYHLEDDWEFYEYGFIDDAFDIFEYSLNHKDKTYKYSIVLCWTMGFSGFVDPKNYPPQNLTELGYGNITIYMMKYPLDKGFGAFTFNAGLYPKFIYDFYGPFVKDPVNLYDGKSAHESSISKRMKKQKLHIALTYPPKCDHIGKGRSVRRSKMND